MRRGVRKKIENGNFQTRLSLPSIIEVVNKLTPEQKSAVDKLGLGGLLHLKCKTLNHKLMAWLIKCFNPETRTLAIHGRKYTITSKDVEVLMGIRSSGIIPKIDGRGEDLDSLGLEVESTGAFSMESLKVAVSRNTSDDDNFKKLFVLLAMGSLCSPGTKPGIRPQLLHLVKNEAEMEMFN